MTQTRTLPLRRCQSDEGDSCVNRKPQTNVRMHQSSRGVREGFPEEGTSWRSWILTDEDFARVEAVGLEAQWGRAERSGAEVPEKTPRGKDTGQQTRQTGTLSLSSELLLTTFLSFGAERLSPSHIKHTLSVYYLFCTMCVSLVRMQALHRQRSLPVVFRTLFPQGLDRCLVQSRHLTSRGFNHIIFLNETYQMRRGNNVAVVFCPSIASTWAVGFQPGTHPGRHCSDPCDEFQMPKLGLREKQKCATVDTTENRLHCLLSSSQIQTFCKLVCGHQGI
nr:uncharacterized protein LOC111775417 [Equus caballus]